MYKKELRMYKKGFQEFERRAMICWLSEEIKKRGLTVIIKKKKKALTNKELSDRIRTLEKTVEQLDIGVPYYGR